MARHHQQSMGRDPGPGMYKEEPAPVADPVSISFQQQLSLPLFLHFLCFALPYRYMSPIEPNDLLASCPASFPISLFPSARRATGA